MQLHPSNVAKLLFPTGWNTKHSIYYSASSLYMFRVSNTPIIRSTQNCNYSLRYWSYFLCSYLPPTWPSYPFQRDETQRILFIILQVHSTRFGCQTHPASGVHKTVTKASGIGHNFCASTSLQRGLAWPRWREVVTVLCTPDDGCVWYPKHVEWPCRIINRMLCVSSRWKS